MFLVLSLRLHSDLMGIIPYPTAPPKGKDDKGKVCRSLSIEILLTRLQGGGGGVGQGGGGGGGGGQGGGGGGGKGGGVPAWSTFIPPQSLVLGGPARPLPTPGPGPAMDFSGGAVPPPPAAIGVSRKCQSVD